MRCQSPITIKDKVTSQNVEVPCGKCAACLSNKRREWACRLSAELQNCASAFFITITYDNEHLVYAGDIPVLMKSEVQKFFKRLRKRIDKDFPWKEKFPNPYPFKYVCVGEYGGMTERPHYHISAFNLPWDREHLEQVLFDTWQNGVIIHVGDLNSRSAMYSFKYIIKEDDLAEDDIRNTDFKRFLLVSRGIGLSYLNKTNVYYLKRGKPPDEYNLIAIDKDRYSIPRYFRKKIKPGNLSVYGHVRFCRKNLQDKIDYMNSMEKQHGENWRQYQDNQYNIFYRELKQIMHKNNKF